MESNVASECSNLDGLFQQIITDLKGSFVVWEDFTNKASKLHGSLRTTVVAASAFLETFQKLADMALGTRGAASDLGSALTRLCLRQRTLEDKLKTFSNTLINLITVPIQERVEEWRRNVVQLDKDHAKESKRVRQDVRKAYSETMRWKKKAKKGKPDVVRQLEISLSDYNTKYAGLELLERGAVNTALLEERSHYCFLVRCLKPVMDCEVEMLTELTHIKEIMDKLHMQAAEPFVLSQNSERVILDRTRICVDNMNGPKFRDSHRDSQGSRKSSQSSASSNSCLQSPSHRCIQNWPTPKSSHSTDTSGQSESSTGCDISLAGSTATSINPYAVPNSVANSDLDAGDNPDETFYFRSVSEPGTALEYCVCGQPMCGPQSAPVMSTPLGGYVNMNQLASMAVQQQEMCQKIANCNDNKKKQCDIVECCQPTASNLCSLHSSLQCVSAADGHSGLKVNNSTTSQVIYSGVATVGRRSESTDRTLSPRSLIRSATTRPSVIGQESTLVPTSSAPLNQSFPVNPPENQSSSTADPVDMLPLPPSPQEILLYNNIDDLPLPPPPSELCAGYEQQCTQDSRVSRRDVLRHMPSDSASEYAKQQGASLAVRRAASARRASEISRFGFSTAAAARREESSKVEEDALTACIKQGVKLKKVTSRDRSAPRLPIQH